MKKIGLIILILMNIGCGTNSADDAVLQTLDVDKYYDDELSVHFKKRFRSKLVCGQINKVFATSETRIDESRKIVSRFSLDEDFDRNQKCFVRVYGIPKDGHDAFIKWKSDEIKNRVKIRSMPLGNKTQMTEDERKVILNW